MSPIPLMQTQVRTRIRLISCTIGRHNKNNNKKPFGGVRYKRWFRKQDILRYEDRLEPDEGGFGDDTDPWMLPPPPNVAVGSALGPMQGSSRMASLPRHKPHHAIGKYARSTGLCMNLVQ